MFGAGETEQEAKESFDRSHEMALEYAEETGEWGDYASLKSKYSIEYTYGLSVFSKHTIFLMLLH